MELEHNVFWAYASLLIGLAMLLFFSFGGIYIGFGLFLGLMAIVLMAAVYINLYSVYSELLEKQRKEAALRKKKIASFEEKERKDGGKSKEK